MEQSLCPIGVLDSGVGGLTVVRELRRVLPGESIVYFGDNANCPYGNNTTEQMLGIARNMLDFLVGKGAKMVVLACNTISSMLELIEGEYEIPLVSIIAPVARALAAGGPGEVGVIATEYTIRSGCYQQQIQAHNPGLSVWGESSHDLARLVDAGTFDYDRIDADVQAHVAALRGAHPDIGRIVLGCTHYPIVDDAFRRAAPDVELVDPAGEQVAEVRRILASRSLLAKRGERGALNIYTSGGAGAFPAYRAVLDKLGIAGDEELLEV